MSRHSLAEADARWIEMLRSVGAGDAPPSYLPVPAMYFVGDTAPTIRRAAPTFVETTLTILWLMVGDLIEVIAAILSSSACASERPSIGALVMTRHDACGRHCGEPGHATRRPDVAATRRPIEVLWRKDDLTELLIVEWLRDFLNFGKIMRDERTI